MARDASSAPEAKRSIEQVEADLAQTREELAATLGVLSDRVNPKLVAARAKESAKAKVSDVTDRAKGAGRSAGGSAKGFADDVAHGKPKAIVVAAVLLGLAAGAVVFTVKRHR